MGVVFAGGEGHNTKFQARKRETNNALHQKKKKTRVPAPKKKKRGTRFSQKGMSSAGAVQKT